MQTLLGEVDRGRSISRESDWDVIRSSEVVQCKRNDVKLVEKVDFNDLIFRCCEEVVVLSQDRNP